MSREVHHIAHSLSLRPPQRDSLEILAHVCELIDPRKDADAAEQLRLVQGKYPHVADFERDFPSFCFQLATGVGKTRLMGAFIAWLHRVKRIRHFFVLAPNLTIYRKLIADFTPNTPKYVFQGIAEFAIKPPLVITGEDYEQGQGVRREYARAGAQHRLWDNDDPVHINIFNISKINTEVRGNKAPRIKSLNEYVGDSYFNYLSELDDLVLLMDEAHRYRANAGMRAINELKPILGLELTATPQVQQGVQYVPFKNTIYSYPLSAALKDGFIKQPAVATRENFRKDSYDEAGLERLKLEDGVRIHEETKVQLEIHARERRVPQVKPFLLVIAQNTDHANALEATIQAPDFFHGAYAGKVITVHSQTKGVEKDEVVEKLLDVENPRNPVEIVIHVNMLREGWDVTNLYTIVPLRAADSRTLVEQSIGRGLRLPYGKRTGNPPADRLTIVAHDKFQEIVDEAERGNSILVEGVIIGRDIPERKTQVVEVAPTWQQKLTGGPATGAATPAGKLTQPPLFTDPLEVVAADKTLEIINEQSRLLKSSGELTRPEVRAMLKDRLREALRPTAPQLDGLGDQLDDRQLDAVIEKTTQLVADMTIDVPRITVVPKGEVHFGYEDFDLDVSGINQQPVDDKIVMQTLVDNERYYLVSLAAGHESRLEDYLVNGLIDCDDVSYDDHAELLYKLSGQAVRKLQSYLPSEDEVRNVLVAYRQSLVKLIHAQMQEHFTDGTDGAAEYEVRASKGFSTLKPAPYQAPAGETPRPFRQPVEDRQNIRKMLFTGFSKCLYPIQKFDSDSERRFAVLLENDQSVLKWLKPARGMFQTQTVFQILYSDDDNYEPDFLVETAQAKYLCEPKAENQMSDATVLRKADAAASWCRTASQVDSKPWKYLLIPHTAIDEAQTLTGLTARYEHRPA